MGLPAQSGAVGETARGLTALKCSLFTNEEWLGGLHSAKTMAVA